MPFRCNRILRQYCKLQSAVFEFTAGCYGGMALKGITPQERLEKWNAAICAQKASGLTIKEWCEQNGINSNTYYYYLRRIRDAMLESSGTLSLHLHAS